ncbi:putative zinc finger protein CONSTANS-LIKE 11 [Salvia miltiorrhiza]|uniref:putative zinc finger protein CONSTANS-LIKE 11 n=1 Tax=Salvia miltiorrhiza TaxID=226208 RepID=UPI0025AD440A|nr:putative zinc finger protein CONSTANS-LIKE 11 [Salvia miltiorrhiza]
MSGPYWYQLYSDRVSEHDDQFSLVRAPVAEHVYESVLGETGHSSSGCSSHVDSPNSNGTTYGAQSPTLMQREVSCHSLINTKVEGYYNIESESSHGSSQWYNKWSNYPFASENSIFESMNRATPYSPEEKKERIERYRSKRNLRNFNKKIKYECRKTLADRRPRVRGRFAKNDEIYTEEATQRPFQEEEDDEYYSWITILDALNKSDAALISSF